MKLTPSSTARRKTFFAFSRSGGQPQIPSPVNRIAPNPSRLTNRSRPNRTWNPAPPEPPREFCVTRLLKRQLHLQKSPPKMFAVSRRCALNFPSYFFLILTSYFLL